MKLEKLTKKRDRRDWSTDLNEIVQLQKFADQNLTFPCRFLDFMCVWLGHIFCGYDNDSSESV